MSVRICVVHKVCIFSHGTLWSFVRVRYTALSALHLMNVEQNYIPGVLRTVGSILQDTCLWTEGLWAVGYLLMGCGLRAEGLWADVKSSCHHGSASAV